jgi:radical SAM superfamily enzyme YgiQ (UPF0313 family)
MSASRCKVVLYNPEALFYTMPLPLLAVGSALDRARCEVCIIDGRLEADPVARVLAAIGDAACLGVTVHTGAPIRDALRVSRAAKARRPELPVVWGGWYPSLFPLDPLADPAIDVTIQGQGETTFAEVVQHLAAGDKPVGVAGSAFRSESGPVINPPRTLRDVNGFPAHDYEMIAVERYFTAKGRRQLDYVASMGCNFRCAFCADPLVYNRGWVVLEPRRVGEEIGALARRYRHSDLAFQDETLFTDKRWVAALADEFLRRDLRFTWTGTMRADQAVRLPDDVLRHCVRSGLRSVLMGVESGSQQMLDWLLKDITVDQVLAAAEKCRRFGLGVIFPFIVGFPDESDASVQATFELMTRLRAMSPTFETPLFYYKPYPGSPITEQFRRSGYPLPSGMAGWAEFEFTDSSGPWVREDKHRRIERFKFYNRFAGGPETLLRAPLQQLARWRVRRDFYDFPIEKFLVDRVKPSPRLS